jgi:hypothetical protein
MLTMERGEYEARYAAILADLDARTTWDQLHALASLAAKDARVHISCRNPSCDHMAANHYGLTLPAAEAARLWGAETTLAQLRPKVKCSLCGARWPSVAIEVSTPSATMGVSA